MTSKRDQARYDKLHRIGCVACRKKGLGWRAVDIHHIVDKGYREHSGGNRATLPLCEYHHRGVPAHECLTREMYEIFGPSLALKKREFKRVFGTERELLAEVDQLIEAMA